MAQETDGILQVGEVPVVVRRDSQSAADYSQAQRSAAQHAYEEMLQYIDRAEAAAEPYTDLRPYADMRQFATDRLRAVMSDG